MHKNAHEILVILFPPHDTEYKNHNLIKNYYLFGHPKTPMQ